MPVFTDQTGRQVSIPGNPQRIVSLVPSQTELLFDLGLNEKLVGITKFCIHPGKWFRSKTRVGGTKQVKMDIIQQLQPDLIIANKEENVKEQIEELAKQFPVWISDVNNLADAYEMIRQVGIITNKPVPAEEMILRIKEAFSWLKTNAPLLHRGSGGQARPRTCYLIWQEPFMAAGGDTFIHSMLEAAGFENVFAKEKRYPELSIVQLQNAGCGVLFLSSEPFPFKQKHADDLKALLPGTTIVLVDGEMFSWYGSRLLYAPAYFKEMMYPLP